MIWAAGKGWTLAQVLLLIARGSLPAVSVYLTKFFVDALIYAIKEPQTPNIVSLVWVGLFLAGVMVLGELLGSILQMVYTAHAEKLQSHIFELIHQRSISVDLAFYEQPDFFDHLHRARNEARDRPLELTIQLGSLLQNGITLLTMSLVLIRFGLWLPLLLVITAIPAFYVVLRHNVRLHDWHRRKTVDERRMWYFDSLLTDGNNAAELRLFDLGSYFRNKFTTLREKLRRERLALATRQRVSELFANLTTLVLTALAFAWVIWRTLNGAGTLGDLALFYQAFSQGQNLAKGFLNDAGKLYANGLFIGDLFEFLALEPKVVDADDPVAFPNALNTGISIQNVSFHYGSGDRPVIDKLNLFIPANKIVAVVGENGAGKSTLIKLLSRFYDVDAGDIKYDEKNIREFSLKALRDSITVLFQSAAHYNMTVCENIILSKVDTEYCHDEIRQAAEAAGAEDLIDTLPDGYEQMLGHRFPDGTELSVGEWQKIALARAFLRQSPIIMLDEPTSSMDPWAEAEWLKRFEKMARGKTVLIITHRFTTAAIADLIYVMEKGKVTESGSHDDLISKNGRYALSWQQQVEGKSKTPKNISQ